jgi:hypothetical protein
MSYPQCDKHARNKFGQTPGDVRNMYFYIHISELTTCNTKLPIIFFALFLSKNASTTISSSTAFP